jgi:hypothetical protein
MTVLVWLTLKYGSLNPNMVFVCQRLVECVLWMVEIQIEMK